MGFFSKLFGKKEAPAQKAAPAPATDKKLYAVDPEAATWQSSGVPQELAAGEVLSVYNGSNRPVFLDVREDHELQAHGFIPGSVHIPMPEIQGRLDELDPEKPVIVYCASGMRSMDVGAFLIEKGFVDVSNLNGGIHGWSGPVERVQT